MKLKNLYTKYNTDKGTTHSYIEIYDEIFEPYKNQQINFLEIGCLTCESLRMFDEFFTSAKIYGIDNWSQRTDFTNESLLEKDIDIISILNDIKKNHPNINIITCDSTDLSQVESKLKGLRFKLIIDDGDHSQWSQLTTFQNMINFLEEGGTYIIEDVNRYYIHGLVKSLKDHMTIWNLNLTVQAIEWHKNNRPDDAIIIIK
ncbi:MAG: hypothetical protein EBT86_05970 [Actinobacteria bacterium]|nr:hypothetical protein [Actinomycetota bacterium]